MKLVDLLGVHVEAASGAPLVLLREHDAPHRVVPIFIGDTEATAIAVALAGQPTPRPLTHDLMAALVDSLDGHVDAVEVTDMRDGTFLASIALSSPSGTRRLDTRPSDAIALAVRTGAPLLVSDAVLDEAGTILNEAGPDEAGPEAPTLDEAEIDHTVDAFRAFLDELDPADFATATDEPVDTELDDVADAEVVEPDEGDDPTDEVPENAEQDDVADAELVEPDEGDDPDGATDPGGG